MPSKVYSPNLGKNFRRLRKEQNLTQQQVADELGVTRPTYTKWESGVAEPSIYFIIRLVKILSTDFNTLFMQNESNA